MDCSNAESTELLPSDVCQGSAVKCLILPGSVAARILSLAGSTTTVGPLSWQKTSWLIETSGCEPFGLPKTSFQSTSEPLYALNPFRSGQTRLSPQPVTISTQWTEPQFFPQRVPAIHLHGSPAGPLHLDLTMIRIVLALDSTEELDDAPILQGSCCERSAGLRPRHLNGQSYQLLRLLKN